jgi:hypothetical protein
MDSKKIVKGHRVFRDEVFEEGTTLFLIYANQVARRSEFGHRIKNENCVHSIFVGRS